MDSVSSPINETPGDYWHSVAVCLNGSYNCVRDGKWEMVQDLPLNEFSRTKIDGSVAELKEEKSLDSELL